VTVGYPKGRITVDVTVGLDEASIQRVAVGRTTRPIMAGQVFYRDETVRCD
jgi:2-methylaconitate cis-trans-isomerase PrpF